MTNKQLINSSVKWFSIVALIIISGSFIRSHMAEKQLSCQMFKGVMVKGTCIYPR